MEYLYLKTHNKTGLKYLGKTKQDPYKYKGSGKYWKRHIEKHGYNVTTEILLITQDKDELKETGLFFSKLLNVVESNEYANLKEENGDGGSNKGRQQSLESNLLRSNTLKNRILSSEHKSKIGVSNSKPKSGKSLKATIKNGLKGANARRGQKDSEETKRKRNQSVSNATKGISKPWLCKKILIDNQEYIGFRHVIEKFGITRQTVYNRIKSDKWDWKYVN